MHVSSKDKVKIILITGLILLVLLTLGTMDPAVLLGGAVGFLASEFAMSVPEHDENESIEA